jgi:hypothetical protein
MKVDWYTQIGQFLIIPTIKITFDRTLNGYYELIFAWGAWGIGLQF